MAIYVIRSSKLTAVRRRKTDIGSTSKISTYIIPETSLRNCVEWLAMSRKYLEKEIVWFSIDKFYEKSGYWIGIRMWPVNISLYSYPFLLNRNCYGKLFVTHICIIFKNKCNSKSCIYHVGLVKNLTHSQVILSIHGNSVMLCPSIQSFLLK